MHKSIGLSRIDWVKNGPIRYIWLSLGSTSIDMGHNRGLLDNSRGPKNQKRMVL